MLDLLILNFNDWETCVKLINRTKKSPIFDKILLVDNCSTDDSYEKLKTLESGKIVVISTDKNGGYGYGNNCGINYLHKIYNSKYILLANPDVIFQEQSIIHLVNFLDENRDYAVVAPIMTNIKNDIMNNSGWYIPELGKYILSFSILYSKYFSNININPCKLKKIIDTDAISGSLILFRTSDMIRFGMYDENVFLYCEETILGFKLKKAGLRSAIITSEKYIHNHSVSINKVYDSELKKRKIMLKSKLYVLKEYYKANFFQYVVALIISKLSLVELFFIIMLKKKNSF